MKPAILLWVAFCLVALALAGCTTPIVRTVEVQVPVAIPCVPPSLPLSPAYADPDSELRTAVDPAERYRLVLVGREQRIARLGVLETVIDACRSAS